MKSKSQNMADMIHQKMFGEKFQENQFNIISRHLERMVSSFNIRVLNNKDEKVTRYGIMLSLENDMSMKGASCITSFDTQNSKYKIQINSEESSKRINFGIVHGFGHLVFGHLEPNEESIIDYKYNNYDDNEEIVNDFCGRLLVPYHSLYECSRNCTDIQKIADIHGVTEILITKRLKQTGII